MSSSTSVWSLGGSRNLSQSGQALAAYVAGQLLRSRATLAVGCCRGADAAIIECAAGTGFASRLWVFTAFGPVHTLRGAFAAAGTCSSSAVDAVQTAKAAGAAIVPWAGGGPDLPIVARLRGRTSHVACAATSGGVIVSDGAWGPGSCLLASSLAGLGLPVYAITVAALVPPPPVPGAWAAGSFVGVPCWRLPASGQAALALAA